MPCHPDRDPSPVPALQAGRCRDWEADADARSGSIERFKQSYKAFVADDGNLFWQWVIGVKIVGDSLEISNL